jgi:secreted PhoX family phosphatase
MQFGYNNDYIGFVSLPAGSRGSGHGLLCVNHEYTSKEVMFPGVGDPAARTLDFSRITRELVEIEMAAHGASVLEVRRDAAGRWTVVRDSRYARRITAADTRMRVSGPAAGHDRLKTTADPTGTQVVGTLNNCAGGITPWGTYLLAEENFHGYFWGAADGTAEARNHKRYGVPGRWYNWGAHHARFDVSREPNEPNRFGWIVEVDPYDPTSMPVKRTALGRTKHEGAETIVNRDGRVVLYSGDDERFEYVYKATAASTPTTARPTRACSTPARSSSRASTRTAPRRGCPWSGAPARSLPTTASPVRPTSSSRPAARRTCSAPRRWIAPRTSRPTG